MKTCSLNTYYVYEITIDDVVVYVGVSNKIDTKYPTTDAHHYCRLKAHGFFCEKITAKRRLEQNNIGRFKKEILEAISNEHSLGFNIPLYGVTEDEALALEESLITFYKPRKYKFVERDDGLYEKILIEGQLINKAKSPIKLSGAVNTKSTFPGRAGKSWWASLDSFTKEEYKKSLARKISTFKENNPEQYAINQKKFHDAGVKATSKEFRKESTRIKQSENMKKRWARNEHWIEAKNALSSKLLKEKMQDPVFKEISRQAIIRRNNDKEYVYNMQRRMVCRLYLAIKENGKDLNDWKNSYKELVSEKKYPEAKYRIWSNYFSSFDEIEEYIKNNDVTKKKR